MLDLFSSVLPYKVLASHIVLAVLAVLIMLKHRSATTFLGKHAVLLTFLVSLTAVVGSLFYSEVMGYEPCVLCWWQRVCLYPIPVITGIALWRKTGSVLIYTTPLAVVAGVISLYQSYVNLGGSSILPCTADGSACAKVYVLAFGYITIPVMSLTISLYLLLIAWAYKIYRNENSYA